MEISEVLRPLADSLVAYKQQGNELANSISFFDPAGGGYPGSGTVIIKAGLPVAYVPVGQTTVSLRYPCEGNDAVPFLPKGTLFGKHYVPAAKGVGAYMMSDLLCRTTGITPADYAIHTLTVPGGKTIQVVEFLHDMEVTFSTVPAILPQQTDAWNKQNKTMAMNRVQENYVLLTVKPAGQSAAAPAAAPHRRR